MIDTTLIEGYTSLRRLQLHLSPESILSPLYYTSLMGLVEASHQLLIDHTMDVNAQGGF